MNKEFKAKFTADNKDFNKKADQVAKKSSKLGNAVKKVGGIIAAAFAFERIFQGFKKIITNTAEFEKALSELSAITGAVGKDLKYFSDQAREMGRTTTYGAAEVAKAFQLMGGARPELLKDKEALAGVTKETLVLAEASGLDLTAATYALAGAMNQFNVPAAEASKIINALAAGSKEGAAEIPDITASIKSMGTVANMANVSVEESVGLIETLADKAIVGSEAGTMLRNVLLKLQVGADKYNPKIVGMSKALENLADANLSAAEMVKMFDVRSYQAAATLIQNRGKYEAYTKAITGTNTAYEQQAIMLDNVSSQWKIFTGALNTATIGGDKFTTSLKNMLTASTDLLQGMAKITESESLKWWEKMAIKFNQIIPNGLKFTNEQMTVLAEHGIAYTNKGIKEIVKNAKDLDDSLNKVTETVKEDDTVIVKHVDTIKDYKDKIEELVASLDLLTTGEGKEAEQIRHQINGYKELIDGVLSYRTIIESPLVVSDSTASMSFMIDTSGIDELDEYAAAVDEFLAKTTPALTAAQEAAKLFGDEMVSSSIMGMSSMKDFANAAVESARKVIATYLAETVAAQIKVWAGTGPFGLIAGGVAAAAAVTMFNNLIPSFAEGGGVSGPTMALVGEAPGISRSNPEYIGTASQLSGMGIGSGGVLTCRVSQGDLLFTLNEAAQSNNNNF